MAGVPGLFLDQEVGIDELPAEHLCQQHADRALAGARHAGEDDVFPGGVPVLANERIFP